MASLGLVIWVAATVSADASSSEGGLTPDVIQRVIKRHQTQVKYCYERALAKDPDLGGRVKANFTVEANGTVSKVALESTLNAPEVEGCLVGQIQRWRFPEPEGGRVTTIGYPWIFKPAEGEGAPQAKTTAASPAAPAMSELDPIGLAILHCWERVVAQGTIDGGEISVRVKVAADGSVSDVQILEGDALGSSGRGCVMGGLAGARFNLGGAGAVRKRFGLFLVGTGVQVVDMAK